MSRHRPLAAAVAALGLAGPAPAAAPPVSGAAETRRVAVVLEEQVPLRTLERLAEAGAPREAVLARLRALARRTQEPFLRRLAARAGAAPIDARGLAVANVLVAEVPSALVSWLARQPEVARVLPQVPRPVFGATAPAGPPSAAWGLDRTGARRVHEEIGVTGRGIVVAVVDTGICPEHPGIAGRIWVNPGEDLDGDGVPLDPDDENGLDDDGNGYVDDLIGWDFAAGGNRPIDTVGHGSHVAGIVAGSEPKGTAVGYAPGAKVMPLRVGSGSAREADVWEAIDYALANGADVISLSLGWRRAWHPDRATWRRIVDAATAAGVPVVAAAGNEGWFDTVRTPADVPSAIAVGASSREDRVATFSSRGPVTWDDVPPYFDYPPPEGLLKPDLTAPGVDVPSHRLCEGLMDSSGTSMAAPAVSGAIALLLEIDPSLRPGDLRRLLETTAIDLEEPGPDNAAGYGRIDVFRAAEAARGPIRATARSYDDTASGDGDGAPEPGERVRLVVALTNEGEAPARGVAARLVSETPAARVLEAEAVYGVLAPGETRGPEGPGFLVEVGGECGDRLRFRVEVEARFPDGPGFSLSVIRDRTGRPELRVLFEDDMESDRGWSVSGSAVTGRWERGDPQGTSDGGRPAQPSEDASPDGRRAFVTGNTGGGASDDDVDGGEALLVSPPIDARGFAGLELAYARWLYVGSRPGWPDRAGGLVLEASDDGGRTWIPVEIVRDRTGGWVRVTEPLDGLIVPGPELRIRARAYDTSGPPGDLIVEAALDDVVLRGERRVCDGP